MKKYVGILCGIVSAVSYGTNPLFGVPLLRVGYGVESMLFFRFLGAAFALRVLFWAWAAYDPFRGGSFIFCRCAFCGFLACALREL